MSLKVENIVITEKKISETKELTSILKLMEKYGIDDPIKLLPSKPTHKVSFELTHTYSGFANAIRRMLIGEISCRCMTFDEKDMQTDDEFILSDVLMKNVNLIPIWQDIDEKEFSKWSIHLFKYNDTNDIIDIKASDFKITILEKRGGLDENNADPNDFTVDLAEAEYLNNLHNSEPKTLGGGPIRNTEKKNNSAKEISLDKLIPEGNITIMRLRRGKYLKIKKITFIEGKSENEAHKFTLLDNVTYDIISEVEHYDMFTDVGMRSMEYDPTKFKLSFTTTGNITPQEVMRRCCIPLIERLENIKSKLVDYTKSDLTKKYYFAEGCEVKVGDITEYRFAGEYITIANMVAQRCFLIDENILHCTPAIVRYDNNIAIIRLKHADRNKLLIKAFDACIQDVQILLDSLLKKLNN